MKQVVPKTARSRFIEILMNNPDINSLPNDEMRKMIAKIMEDLDADGILDPINYDDYDEDGFGDDLDKMCEIEFDESRTQEEKEIAIEFLKKPKDENSCDDEDVITLESLKRIREKRRELAEHAESGIHLTAEDYEDGESPEGEEVVMPNSYGRSPLHEAIGMRNLDSIRKYVSEGKFLDTRDNNGNTPFQMAYQEGYMEAVAVFEEHSVAA